MPWLLHTERLSVRPKTIADARSFHALYSDEEVMRFSGGRFATLERTRDFVASHVHHQELHGFSMWALIHRASGTLLDAMGSAGRGP